MKWFQIKEQAAGEKRLMITWLFYKLFGKKAVQIIAFFVAFFAFLFSGQIKKYTKKNLSVIFDYTKNPKAKPSVFNQYKLVLNYALSLADRLEVFAGRYDAGKLMFVSEDDKECIKKEILNKKGIFFICSHTGNIEVLRTFIENPINPINPHVNIFLSENQCRIFNGFLKRIEAKTNVSVYPVEKISIDTAIELKDKLENAQIAFMAGDRISSSSENTCFRTQFLNKMTEFPSGTFKLAQLMEMPVYFICALKGKNDFYYIHSKKFNKDLSLTKAENLKRMQNEYIMFLEEMIMKEPTQFYHFYDIFSD